MGQSLVKNYLHIIYSTKHRQPLIHKSIATQLHSYLAGICNSLECNPVKIGGYTDHVHILCVLSKKIPLSKLLEEMKSYSSRWMKTKGNSLKNFYWQNGYGAFSVNPSDIKSVIDYIDRQDEHHRKKSFQEEYRQFLRDYEVEFDERYVWD